MVTATTHVGKQPCTQTATVNNGKRETKSNEIVIKEAKFIDITRERWFWDMAVIS
jgi:hypothetical protein